MAVSEFETISNQAKSNPSKSKKVSKKTVFFTGLIIFIFAGIFGYKIFINMMVSKFMAHFAVPPSTVSVITAEDQTWKPFLTATGNVVAVQGVSISPQVSGIVSSINFTSGQMVQAGQILLTLDSREQEGDLASAKAGTDLALINYNRDVKLLATQAVSQSVVDTDLATLQEKKGAQEQAAAQLGYRQIRAPFSGKLGIRLANLGQFLNPGDVITNIQTVDPIYIDYYLPEQDLSKISINQPVEIFATAFPNKIFKGVIEAIDARVSLDTHSILVRAVVKNNDPQAVLTPGMFITAHTILPEQDHVVTLPLQAINYTLYGDSVYLINTKEPLAVPPNPFDKKSNKESKDKAPAAPMYAVKLVYVQTGEQLGNQVEIKSGLSAGQEVVLQGQIKLQDGGHVLITQADSSSAGSNGQADSGDLPE